VTYVDVDHTSAGAVVRTLVGRSIVAAATATVWVLM
jgi:hypothetical protein